MEDLAAEITNDDHPLQVGVHVSGQVVPLLEPGPAHLALELLHVGVHLHVHAEHVFSGKRLSADHAAERLVPRVRRHVGLQVVPLVERLSAHVARVRPALRPVRRMALVVVVRHRRLALVVLQVGPGREGLVAELTVVGLLLLRRVLCFYVVLVLLLVVEAPSAILAREAEGRPVYVYFIGRRVVVLEGRGSDVSGQLVDPFRYLRKLEWCLRFHHSGVEMEWNAVSEDALICICGQFPVLRKRERAVFERIIFHFKIFCRRCRDLYSITLQLKILPK